EEPGDPPVPRFAPDVGVIVELVSVSKSFGSVRALQDVSLELREGEALGVIAGSQRADSGRVLLDGRDVTSLPGHQHVRLGIARTFQIPRPFAGLTAFENVLVGATFGRRHAASPEACIATLQRVGLAAKANTPASALTLLERKRLELARALVTEPRVLLLDEIAGGLTEPEVHELVATVQELRARGTTIVWIEHIVHALLSVVDRLVALATGRTLIEGDPREVIASAELRDVYLGGE